VEARLTFIVFLPIVPPFAVNVPLFVIVPVAVPVISPPAFNVTLVDTVKLLPADQFNVPFTYILAQELTTLTVTVVPAEIITVSLTPGKLRLAHVKMLFQLPFKTLVYVAPKSLVGEAKLSENRTNKTM
jgi:hypothetical protein